ncbi:unnamed protein product [Ectocarpus sp. 6 AP-2014]
MSAVYQEDNFPLLEKNAGAYNAGGQVEVQDRARRLTDPAILAEYGDGWYPLRWVYDKGEMAPNGNYIEPQGISVRHGVCGDPKSGDQGGQDGENTYSTPNKDWPVLQEFKQGQSMEIKAVMKAWHYGHLEFFICDTQDLDDPDDVATQECFNKYPLTRSEGDGVNSPIDPNYPGRYYADPPCRENETEQDYDWRAGGGYVMTMNYDLPENLVCEHCVLQMWYYTGHKCYHPGYEEFNPASWGSECAPNKSDWIDLSIDYCGDNEWNLAEEFWACSDIAITADGSSPAETPTPSPEAAPTATDAPVDATAEPTAAATAEPLDPTPAPIEETAEPTAAATPEPTPAPVEETAEPTTAGTTMTPEPIETTPPPTDGDVGDVEEAEYVGCFHDNTEDRILGDKLDSMDMTTEHQDHSVSTFVSATGVQVCLAHCTELGAAFMATQFGFECWCSADELLDYERHYEMNDADAVCDMSCRGDKTQPCGGFNSFDLYKLQTTSTVMCSGTPVEAYEQCGGKDWAGSTCCMDGYDCTQMVEDGCYAQCRPSVTVEPITTPSPVSTTRPPVALSTSAPVDPATMAPIAPSPVATPAPVSEPTSGCMVVRMEAEDLPVLGDWRVVNDVDASGGKYITWEGLSEGQNNGDPADGDIMSASIQVPTAGTYSFKWLMRQPDGVESDKGNDAWLNFPDAKRYGPAGTQESYGTFIKVYGRATDGDFEYSGTGEDSHGHTQIAIEFEEAGEYAMEISGRSHGLQIDQILVFGEDLSVDEAVANTGC